MAQSQYREFSIEGTDTRDLYGPGDTLLELIRELHPKLRIIARGQTLKVLGSKRDTESFEKRMEEYVAYYDKYGHVSKQVVEQCFAAGFTQQENTGSDSSMPDGGVIVYGNNGLVVKPRTENQKKMVELHSQCDLLFATGPAGSGKTYVAIALAVRALKDKLVRRVILTRPAVEAGEKLGFLPGDLKEKLDPYLQPLYDALNDMIPPAKLQKFLEDGTIQIAPLAYMRGRTLDNAFVILDEAQNTTMPQIKMFLTRMGRNAKFIVTGDVTQIDLPHKADSGLTKTMNTLRNIPGIGFTQFDKEDIVRHELVKKIVEAFDQKEAEWERIRAERRQQEHENRENN